jgi:hypothetical protein
VHWLLYSPGAWWLLHGSRWLLWTSELQTCYQRYVYSFISITNAVIFLVFNRSHYLQCLNMIL